MNRRLADTYLHFPIHECLPLSHGLPAQQLPGPRVTLVLDHDRDLHSIKMNQHAKFLGHS